MWSTKVDNDEARLVSRYFFYLTGAVIVASMTFTVLVGVTLFPGSSACIRAALNTCRWRTSSRADSPVDYTLNYVPSFRFQVGHGGLPRQGTQINWGAKMT